MAFSSSKPPTEISVKGSLGPCERPVLTSGGVERLEIQHFHPPFYLRSFPLLEHRCLERER